MYFFYLVLLLLICICMLLYQNRLWIQSNLVKATIVSDVSWPITRRKLWAILPPWQLHLTWLLIFFLFFSFSFLVSTFNFVFSSLSDTVFAWESFKIQYLHWTWHKAYRNFQTRGVPRPQDKLHQNYLQNPTTALL